MGLVSPIDAKSILTTGVSAIALHSWVGLNQDNIGEAMAITGDNANGEFKTLPTALRSQSTPKKSDSTCVRQFVLEPMGCGMGMMGGQLTFNGERMNLDRVDETVKTKSVEI